MSAENQYRIPKQRVPVTISFHGAPPSSLSLYLSERIATHAGYERPSDLLNGPLNYLPATGPDGSVFFLNRKTIRWVQVDAIHEFDDSIEGIDVIRHPDTTDARAEIVLSDQSTLQGTISFCLPGSHRRVQDFLNLDEQFLILRQENVAVLVNKDQIVHVLTI